VCSGVLVSGPMWRPVYFLRFEVLHIYFSFCSQAPCNIIDVCLTSRARSRHEASALKRNTQMVEPTRLEISILSVSIDTAPKNSPSLGVLSNGPVGRSFPASGADRRDFREEKRGSINNWCKLAELGSALASCRKHIGAKAWTIRLSH
jgi:hypothetical protein